MCRLWGKLEGVLAKHLSAPFPLYLSPSAVLIGQHSLKPSHIVDTYLPPTYFIFRLLTFILPEDGDSKLLRFLGTNVC